MKTRKKISNPRKNELSQGYIFTGALAENYHGCAVHGIVITARCDVANNKVRLLNYLPIVTFNDWLRFDGRIIVCERLRNSALGKMKACLTDIGLDSQILDGVEISVIRKAHFEPHLSIKKYEKKVKLFDEASEDIGLCDRALENNGPEFEALIERNPKIVRSLADELINYKLGGYYFLENLDAYGEESSGYVVLLRQISTLPFHVAERVVAGFYLKTILSNEPNLARYLSNSVHELALPIGCLNSPNIEHLMQAFSALFGRIGIENTAPEVAQYLAKDRTLTNYYSP